MQGRSQDQDQGRLHTLYWVHLKARSRLQKLEQHHRSQGPAYWYALHLCLSSLLMLLQAVYVELVKSVHEQLVSQNFHKPLARRL